MECLYVPALEVGQAFVELTDPDELRHVRALRLRQGERVALTNGRGCLVVGELLQYSKAPPRALFRVVELLEPPEFPVRLGLAIGLLHDRERLEFAVEKAVELGVQEIVLLRTCYAQPCEVRLERLRAKVLAAVKQAHRAWMPSIRGPMGLVECCDSVLPAYRQSIVAEVSGREPAPLRNSPTLVLVGPEGGWSAEELQILQQARAALWSLGQQRLRAETAAVVALGLVRFLLRQS
ncbi:MAG: 16S rRNA (uracil(1498)-N(3))-methyltransferase [Candidatus Kapabacteria bacterium]|nr:16S rRNA (uracil(1498)-N(3))-methyltransferase [Candidatus Kapabacteria bacterium]MDW8012428.1 RsmE family RNA methyltransferase [Bacteroidota bacterium]